MRNTLEIARRLRPQIPKDVEARGTELNASGGAIEDVMEARKTFAEKRKPNFVGSRTASPGRAAGST